MKNKLPLINIITVCYNAKNDLEKTIQSVIKQDYPKINYIIFDGGSKDGTSKMVEKYKDKIGLYVSEEDGGIYEAMNKGIKRTKGGYLNFLNAGDEYISKTTISDIFKDIGDKYDLVYGKIIVGEVTKEKLANPQDTWDFTRKNLLRQNTAVLCHQAMFLKKEATPLYNTSYKIKGDLDWYFKILRKNPDLTFYKSDVTVTNYKGGGISEKCYFLDIFETIKLITKRFGIVSIFKYGYFTWTINRIFREVSKRSKVIFSNR